MLAVVKIAGQQFKVKAGDSLYVPHIEGKSGDKVEFSEVLMTDNDGTLAIGTDVKAVVKAEIYNMEVLPFFEKIRYHVDKLELLVDDELWPLPKYRELLFIK